MKWGKPAFSKKFHIFHNSRSLCRKWIYNNAQDDVELSKPVVPNYGDCKECVKRYNAQVKS